MDPSFEIRKLPIDKKLELINILELDESWKKLMAIIPRRLRKDNYKCDLGPENIAKYRSEDFRLIEAHSKKTKRLCADILFYEWGTSGRVRATLGHLKYLLEKCELYRAADYLAINIMGLPPPPRPIKGPSARVKFKLEELGNKIENIEEILDAINYPSSAIEDINKKNSTYLNLNDLNNSKSVIIPKIIISEFPDHKTSAPTFQIPLVQNSREKSQSDMIKFPSSQSDVGSEEDNIPQLSILLHGSTNNNSTISDTNSNLDNSSFIETSEANLPNMSSLLHSQGDLPVLNFPHLSQLSDSSTESSIQTTSSMYSANVPVLSELNHSSEKLSLHNAKLTRFDIPNMTSLLQSPDDKSFPNLPHLSQFRDSSIEYSIQSSSCVVLPANVPVLSQLNHSVEKPFPHNTLTSSHTDLSSSIPTKNSVTESTNIPALSQLIESSTTNKTQNSKNSRSCNSPLPNLSLNTLLPHFTYQELEFATNNFDETPLSENGRFLGAGHFGQVFLALGLYSKPTAVKKLLLDSVSEVLIDDEVTKQFRNEVEVLSKYKHENLLSLLGYSCDGSTYCLLYDYIPGGALSDRLTKKCELMWTERLYIAMGVAKAVAYLHTAYSTPLIHRDVKTANILLDSNKKPKLSDFGLSTLAPNQNTNSSFYPGGTSAYMAPEAHRGVVSVKLDTFSFGVVLLELLTSLPPIDESREEVDLVIYFQENIDDDITPVLDVSVGGWVSNGINYAQQLFKIAQTCLLEKKRRPTMSEVSAELIELVRNH